MSLNRYLVRAALVLAVATACGSSGLPKDELIAQGDAACAAAGEKLEPLFSKLFPTGSETPEAAVAAPVMIEAASVVREEARTFERLESDDGDFLAIREDVGKLAQLMDSSAQKAAQGDTEGYLGLLQQANEHDAKSRDRMRAFGFRTCAGENT